MRLAPDAIVFDCDGVLVDSDDAVVGAWSAWAVAYGFDPAAVIEVCHGQPARATVAAFLAPDDVAAGIAVIDAAGARAGARRPRAARVRATCLRRSPRADGGS